MRYWNPKKAAARRIALDAIAAYGDGGSPGVSSVVGTEALRPRSETELGVKLARLKDRNAKMFKLVADELAKEGPRRDGSEGGS
ncbi:MAG TPA: hypothetical protein VFE91_07125 [Nitrososphaerales archaeon]|nr:hypothetical protein [Nitrososphaerales archaeon]